MARKTKEPVKPPPLPKKRIPASKITPATPPKGSGHPDRTVSGRIGYFIREFGEFREQVEGLEEQLQVTQERVAYPLKAKESVEHLQDQVKYLAQEKEGLNKDLLELEERYDKAREQLHKNNIRCPDWASNKECDECAEAEAEAQVHEAEAKVEPEADDEKDGVVDELDEPPPPCPKCGGEPTLLGHLGPVTHLRCRACGWTWGREDPDEGDETEAA